MATGPRAPAAEAVTSGRLDVLVDAVQTNCDIADARHAADLPLCIYLLQMREFYRWEHGLTFGASHIGAIQFLARAVPDGQGGTAQGLYMLVTSGIFMAVATGVAGLAYTRYGGMAYLPMAVLSAAGALAFVALERMWRGGVIGAVAGAEHSD